MANKHRGEIDARLDGTTRRLCLTLGALAELETAFGDADMIALAARFESGRLRASDCVRIIGAGLRGSGHDVTDDAVAHMQTEGGVTGFVEIVARLLEATFGAPSNSRDRPAAAAPGIDTAEARTSAAPFPGTT